MKTCLGCEYVGVWGTLKTCNAPLPAWCIQEQGHRLDNEDAEGCRCYKPSLTTSAKAWCLHNPEVCRRCAHYNEGDELCMMVLDFHGVTWFQEFGFPPRCEMFKDRRDKP